jgi:pyrimidine-nucleoside phosphorylase
MKPQRRIKPTMQSLNAIEIIVRKRDNVELSTEQINWFIREYTAGNIPDYQAAAWCMAVRLNGMTRRETVDLTLAMAASGEQLDLSDVVPFAVDKHSSGGVGDKTSLVVLPMVVASGIPVAKMSGRGLGHTGGTLDKLESIRGFRVELDSKEFKRLARENNIVLAGQTGNLAPADKALYALRDVTGTVDSLPLIASSIMSKKIAGGADALVLDVKVGEGAFMRSIDEARMLAQTMVDIGVESGRPVTALLSDMNQPLGVTAGLALEVREAIETLRNEGPADFREHCVVVAVHMVLLAPQIEVDSFEEARVKVEKTLEDGSALEVFRKMVEGQGGDVSQVDDVSLLPQATTQDVIEAPKSGYLSEINARQVGRAVVDLGGGRERKEDPVDHAVGVETLCKVGDYVETGKPLFRLHANEQGRLEQARWWIEQNVFTITEEKVEEIPLFYATVKGKPE